MQTITIEVENSEDAKMILLLAKRLDCKYTTTQKSKKNAKEELSKLFKSIAKRGSLSKTIPNPVQWQKEIRKDRGLIGRT